MSTFKKWRWLTLAFAILLSGICLLAQTAPTQPAPIQFGATEPHGDWLINSTLSNCCEDWRVPNIGTGGNPGYGPRHTAFWPPG